MKKFLAGSTFFLVAACAGGEQTELSLNQKLAKPDDTVRIATFNVSLYRDKEGQLIEDLIKAEDPQFEAVAGIILKVDPDILVLNEFDWHKDNVPLALFRDKYLTAAPSNNGMQSSSWPYIYMLASNTGLNPGTVDFDNNGEITTEPGSAAYASDSFGFGRFVGQYGMAVLSKYPLMTDASRTFQEFRWREMPDNLLPETYYSEKAQEIFRLSSKNHIDLPVQMDGKKIHLLMMHPTPPTFDGPEDRNGRRNHDEIRFFADYISGDKAGYIYDDAGGTGGLRDGERFVILGDLNADPSDGDSVQGAIDQLLDHPMIQDPRAKSTGALVAAANQGGANDQHAGSHEYDTADFRDDGNNAVGNLRLDYVLPSKQGLKVVGSGVFWPKAEEEGYDLVGPGFPPVSSDHRLVWVDLKITD